jgi:hypothetical protein
MKREMTEKIPGTNGGCLRLPKTIKDYFQKLPKYV